MYSGDLNFSIRASEMIYSLMKLNDEEFVNWCASYYHSNRCNILVNELLESIYLSFTSNSNFITINGCLEKSGTKYKKDVLNFSSNDEMDYLKQNVFRKGCFSEDSPNMFHDNEFVLLFEFANVTETKDEIVNEVEAQEKIEESVNDETVIF